MEKATIHQPEKLSHSPVPANLPSSAPRSDYPLFSLQRAVGNQAVGRLLESGIIQAKLRVSQPGDADEQEADRIAEKFLTNSSSGSSPATRYASSLGLGHSLEPSTRSLMESRFGRNFEDVRIHTGEQAAESARSINALAYSTGRDVVFGRNQYQPDTIQGSRLLAHELTHVVQQSSGSELSSNGFQNGPTLEGEAWRAADTVATGGRVTVSGAAADGIQRSTLSAALNAAWSAHHNKGEIFDILRASAPAPTDMDAWTALAAMFPLGTDDAWLAGQIMVFGPETLWPPGAISARVAKATAGPWVPEPGNIRATLPDPGATAGVTPPTVEAFFFPGRSDRRALIISGVHGSEPQGVAVTQQLRTLLATRSAAGHPPFFTTIIAPILIPRTAATGSRTVPGVLGINLAGRLVRHDADPNRNFPLPGEGLATATARGSSSPTAPELQVFDPAAPGGTRAPRDVRIPGGEVSSIRMIPETRILIGLIERFQPERIASVHGHSLKRVVGDAPGIFVDPRGIDPRTGAVTNAAQGAEDDRLATAMVREGRSRLAATPLPATTRGRAPFDPFFGNAPAGSSSSSVHYASTVHAEGSSLGTWAPVPVTGAGARAGITTVTVEVPEYDPTTAGRALSRIEDLDARLLAEIFLEDPAVVTPATAPTVP